MADNFVTFCVACTMPVPVEGMRYYDGRVFHKECFEKHGGNFEAPDPAMAEQYVRLKIQIVQLKSILQDMRGSIARKTAKPGRSTKARKPAKKSKRIVKARKVAKKGRTGRIIKARKPAKKPGRGTKAIKPAKKSKRTVKARKPAGGARVRRTVKARKPAKKPGRGTRPKKRAAGHKAGSSRVGRRGARGHTRTRR